MAGSAGEEMECVSEVEWRTGSREKEGFVAVAEACVASRGASLLRRRWVGKAMGFPARVPALFA